MSNGYTQNSITPALQWSVFATDGICFLFHSFRESGLQEFENLRTAQAAV